MIYELKDFTLETLNFKNSYIAFLRYNSIGFTVRVNEENKSYDNSLVCFTMTSLLNIEKLINTYLSQALQFYNVSDINYDLEKNVIDAEDWACDLHFDACLEDYLSL